MRLSEEEYHQYLDTHRPLLMYTGVKLDVYPKNISDQEFFDIPIREKLEVRNALYDNLSIIDDFVKENPYDLSKESLEIAKSFKHVQKGRYFIFRYLKKYAIFLSEDKVAYGVLTLNDPFEHIVGTNLPVMVEAALLPFKDKIVYDGMIQTYNVRFGGGITGSLKADYNEAKSKYGIITTLPFQKESVDTKFSDKDQLILYMKNANSRERYWYEIEDLLERKPKLWTVYYHEWGRINSRAKKKEIKELGIKGHYFAITNNTILASGKKKQDVEKQVKQLLDPEDLEAVYYFKV